MKRKVRGKVGRVALKIDINKAYDRVSWDFLQAIMMGIGMGFDRNWIEIIMLCVTIASYTVLVNGKDDEPIILGQGLRQGDPLSP